MSKTYTWPSKQVLDRKAKETAKFMHPNALPYAVIVEGYLSNEQCDKIVEELMQVEPYKFSGCGAVTRECPRPHHKVLNPMVDLSSMVNEAFWSYFIDEGPGAWLQTYSKDGVYQLHTDTSPGQSRKLSAVLMLTDPSEYEGGDLILWSPPASCAVPRTRGTVVVFQPWIQHEVTAIVKGQRQTINLGFWGPPLR